MPRASIGFGRCLARRWPSLTGGKTNRPRNASRRTVNAGPASRNQPACHRFDSSMATRSAFPHIVWFRDDLRLSDQPALPSAAKPAAEHDAPVICLYVLDEESPALRLPQARPLGGAARWWLAQSLRSLQQSFHAIGASLVLRRGPAARVIRDLAVETGAEAVFWNEIAQAPYRLQAEEGGASL